MANKVVCSIWMALISLFIALLPVIWIQANRILALDKDVYYHHSEKCKKQSMQTSILDMAELNNEELLVIEHDFNGLFTKGSDEISQGRFLKVIDVAYGSPKFKPIEITGYPQDVAFRPFGLYLDGQVVYALNQALHQGGPRIDVFNYTEDSVIYTHSVLLDPLIGGTFGDLVVHKGFAYLNQYSSVPLEPSPTPFTLMSMIKVFYNDVVQIHESGIYRCPLGVNTKVECLLMSTAKSASVTGITKDEDGFILAAFSSIDYNWIEKYEVVKDGLKFSEKFPLRDKAERLTFSPSINKVYAAALPWPLMGMTSNYVPSGAIEIRKVGSSSSYSYRRLFLQENIIKGVTVASRIGNYIFTASYLDKAVMICPIIDP
jgi:hypothetical protein